MKTITRHETWFASMTEQFSSVFNWKGQSFVARWTDILRCLRANMNSPGQSVLKMHKLFFLSAPKKYLLADIVLPCSALFTRFASLWLHPLPKHYTQAEGWLLSIINHSIGWHILPLLFCNVILTTVSAVNESVLHCFDDMVTWQCFDVISCHYVSYSCHNMSHLIPPYVCTTQAVPKTNY